MDKRVDARMGRAASTVPFRKCDEERMDSAERKSIAAEGTRESGCRPSDQRKRDYECRFNSKRGTLPESILIHQEHVRLL